MIYATSDLHGYSLDKFIALLQKADFKESDTCYVLGDVIDRGREGIKTLIWLMSRPNFKLILGNHEAMMLSCDFLFDEITDESIDKLKSEKLQAYSHWMQNGADQTVNELRGIRDKQIKYILEYLRKAPLYAEVTAGERKFLLTHSGLGSFRKDKKLCEYTAHDFLWTRPTLYTEYFDDIMVVFGHTPTLLYGPEYTGKVIFTDTWIDIDTGSAAGLAPSLLRLDDLKVFYAD